MADADAVIADLVSGAYDDHLVELGEALETRKDSGAVLLSWRIQYEDITIDQTNAHGNGVTVGAALALLRLGGREVSHINPTTSDDERMAVVLAYLMARDNCSLDDATKKISESAFDAIKVSEYATFDLPKDSSPQEASTDSAE